MARLRCYIPNAAVLYITMIQQSSRNGCTLPLLNPEPCCALYYNHSAYSTRNGRTFALLHSERCCALYHNHSAFFAQWAHVCVVSFRTLLCSILQSFSILCAMGARLRWYIPNPAVRVYITIIQHSSRNGRTFALLNPEPCCGLYYNHSAFYAQWAYVR
jgi:hypothetical protein